MEGVAVFRSPRTDLKVLKYSALCIGPFPWLSKDRLEIVCETDGGGVGLLLGSLGSVVDFLCNG